MHGFIIDIHFCIVLFLYFCHMLCFPQAKINLGLHVLRRRPDGYHDIETVMIPVPLHDALEVKEAAHTTEIRIFGSEIAIPLEQNLVYKAWKRLSDVYGISPVLFHLVKQIPSGAGLGGGSSDAAAALSLLNSYFSIGLSDDELRIHAAELGSDCPFFIDATPSIASGRGEILERTSIRLDELTLVIVFPKKLSDGSSGMATSIAYGLVQPADNRPSIEKIVQGPVTQWRTNLINDFQAPVVQRYPEIGQIIHRLYEGGAVYASLSGSGSACYGLFQKKNPDLKFDRDCSIFISEF